MKDIARDYERVLARALRAPDPPAVLAAAARNRRLPAALRRALGAVAPDGLRLAALLVTRLRFERLLRGSGAAAAWFRSRSGRVHPGVRALPPADRLPGAVPLGRGPRLRALAGGQRRTSTPR